MKKISYVLYKKENNAAFLERINILLSGVKTINQYKYTSRITY